jgi:hypothetical protein
MLLSRDYRDRAIGLVAAFAVLGTGIGVTGALAKPRSAESPAAASAERQDEKGTSECTLAHRAEQTVPIC